MEVIAFTKKEGIHKKEILTIQSPALPENPLTNKEFRNWIEKSESAPNIPLSEAKSKWANKRKQLQKLTK